ncbi:MAG: hypothetical protein NTZ59_10295 [Bacteroidetes bacterium]|nr:hypothetical protein [Bacteroidota bacterium]
MKIKLIWMLQLQQVKKNVDLTIADALKQSIFINELVKEGKVKIFGAFCDITCGKVIFLN